MNVIVGNIFFVLVLFWWSAPVCECIQCYRCDIDENCNYATYAYTVNKPDFDSCFKMVFVKSKRIFFKSYCTVRDACNETECRSIESMSKGLRNFDSFGACKTDMCNGATSRVTAAQMLLAALLAVVG